MGEKRNAFYSCGKEVFLPALVGAVFPRLLELKRLMVLHCFQMKGEKTSDTFFGWIYLSVSYWKACKHALIQFLLNYFAFIVLKKTLLLRHNWHRKICSCLVYDFGAKCASLLAQTIKNLPAVPETWVQSLSWEDPLETGMATLSSTLDWRIPWTGEPGRPQSLGSQRTRHD